MRLGQVLWVDRAHDEGVLEDVRTGEQFRFSPAIQYTDGQLVNFDDFYDTAVFMSPYNTSAFAECSETLTRLMTEVALGKRMTIAMEQE